jgi:glycosyltransferase involved in cell wall biosynthesis
LKKPVYILLYEFAPLKFRALRGGKIILDRLMVRISRTFDIYVITGDNFRWNKPLRLAYWFNTFLVGLKIISLFHKHKKSLIILMPQGTYGELVSIIVRILCPRIKIVGIIWHYEPRVTYKKGLIRILSLIINTFEENLRSIAFKFMYNKIFTLTKSVAHMTQKYYSLTPSKISVLGCSFDRFPIEKDIKKDFDYIFIGHLKKAEDLIKIWPKLLSLKSSANLLVVGPYKGAENTFKKLTSLSNVKYYGVINPPERGKIYSKAKVLLFPSKREGWCMTIAEALWVGLPVVTWDIPALREVYSACEAVYLVPMKDYNSFVKYAIKALEEYGILSEKAKRWISKIPSWDSITDTFLKVILADL